MKIYTKTGDEGTTGLLGRGRVPKDDFRIAAYGTVDELNALLGVARAAGPGFGVPTGWSPSFRTSCSWWARRWLILVRTASSHNTINPSTSSISSRPSIALETELEPLVQFILPGGAPAAAQLHLARTVCRRAERLVVELSREPGRGRRRSVLVYLNRLSDLLFVLARAVNHRAGVADVLWKGI